MMLWTIGKEGMVIRMTQTRGETNGNRRFLRHFCLLIEISE